LIRPTPLAPTTTDAADELCAGTSALVDECGCGQGLLRSDVILGIIVWLLLLTLLNVFLLAVLVAVRRAELRQIRSGSSSPTSSPSAKIVAGSSASARRNPANAAS